MVCVEKVTEKKQSLFFPLAGKKRDARGKGIAFDGGRERNGPSVLGVREMRHDLFHQHAL